MRPELNQSDARRYATEQIMKINQKQIAITATVLRQLIEDAFNAGKNAGTK